MEDTTSRINDLKAQIETTRKKIMTKEEELAQEEEALKKEKEALKEAGFQETLETIENKLVPLFQKERECENQICSFMNKLFKRTARDVKKINLMFKDLRGFKKEIKNVENQIAQNAQQDGSAVREALELKRIQFDQDFEVIKQVKGASFLVKQVNTAMGNPEDAYEGLLKEEFSHLPVYALNIYDSAKRAGVKSLRARVDDLIRISRLPETKIVLARDMVVKFLDKLKENNLIEYSLSGDTYTIRDSKA